MCELELELFFVAAVFIFQASVFVSSPFDLWRGSMAGSSKDGQIPVEGINCDDSDAWTEQTMSTPSPVVRRRHQAMMKGESPDWTDKEGAIQWSRIVKRKDDTDDNKKEELHPVIMKARVLTETPTLSVQEPQNCGAGTLTADWTKFTALPEPRGPTIDERRLVNVVPFGASPFYRTPERKRSIDFSNCSPPGAPMKRKLNPQQLNRLSPAGAMNQQSLSLSPAVSTPSKVSLPDYIRSVNAPDSSSDVGSDSEIGNDNGHAAEETPDPSSDAVANAPSGWVLEWDSLTPEQREIGVNNPDGIFDF